MTISKRRGRPSSGKPMTAAERMAKSRAKAKENGVVERTIKGNKHTLDTFFKLLQIYSLEEVLNFVSLARKIQIDKHDLAILDSFYELMKRHEQDKIDRMIRDFNEY